MNAILNSGCSARATYQPSERGHDNPFVDVFFADTTSDSHITIKKCVFRTSYSMSAF